MAGLGPSSTCATFEQYASEGIRRKSMHSRPADTPILQAMILAGAGRSRVDILKAVATIRRPRGRAARPDEIAYVCSTWHLTNPLS